MPDAVRNNKADQRFEMRAGEDIAVAYYRLEPGVITQAAVISLALSLPERLRDQPAPA